MGAGNTVGFAFIGFGEVGQTFSKGLAASGAARIAAYDLKFGSADGDRLQEAARTLNVETRASAADAAHGAHVVISAVTADQAERVARDAATFLKPGQIFLDVNSAAPSTKRRAAQAVEAVGAFYVEAAVMAPVKQPGLAVPILAGGSAAEEAAALLNPLGMNLTPVSVEHGRASAMKLCRSIVIKGLEALMVDCANASREWNVEAEVFGSLGATYPSIDWRALAEDMRERVETHGVRRSAEMREAAEMLAAMNHNPDLALAVASAQLRGAKPKP